MEGNDLRLDRLGQWPPVHHRLVPHILDLLAKGFLVHRVECDCKLAASRGVLLSSQLDGVCKTSGPNRQSANWFTG